MSTLFIVVGLALGALIYLVVRKADIGQPTKRKSRIQSGVAAIAAVLLALTGAPAVSSATQATVEVDGNIVQVSSEASYDSVDELLSRVKERAEEGHFDGLSEGNAESIEDTVYYAYYASESFNFGPNPGFTTATSADEALETYVYVLLTDPANAAASYEMRRTLKDGNFYSSNGANALAEDLSGDFIRRETAVREYLNSLDLEQEVKLLNLEEKRYNTLGMKTGNDPSVRPELIQFDNLPSMGITLSIRTKGGKSMLLRTDCLFQPSIPATPKKEQGFFRNVPVQPAVQQQQPAKPPVKSAKPKSVVEKVKQKFSPAPPPKTHAKPVPQDKPEKPSKKTTPVKPPKKDEPKPSTSIKTTTPEPSTSTKTTTPEPSTTTETTTTTKPSTSTKTTTETTTSETTTTETTTPKTTEPSTSETTTPKTTEPTTEPSTTEPTTTEPTTTEPTTTEPTTTETTPPTTPETTTSLEPKNPEEDPAENGNAPTIEETVPEVTEPASPPAVEIDDMPETYTTPAEPEPETTPRETVEDETEVIIPPNEGADEDDAVEGIFGPWFNEDSHVEPLADNSGHVENIVPEISEEIIHEPYNDTPVDVVEDQATAPAQEWAPEEDHTDYGATQDWSTQQHVETYTDYGATDSYVEEWAPEPVYEAPVEEWAPEPIYEAPVEEWIPEPVYEAPAEEWAPEPVYEAPVEEWIPAEPAYVEPAPEPVYEAPVQEDISYYIPEVPASAPAEVAEAFSDPIPFVDGGEALTDTIELSSVSESTKNNDLLWGIAAFIIAVSLLGGAFVLRRHV